MAFDREGAKAAGYTDEEIDAYLNRPKEGVGTFLKSAASATGVPKFLKTLGAAGLGVAAGVGNVTGQKWALPLAEKALKLREETGTTGSVQQGVIPTLKTLGNVGEATARTAATVYGAATAPVASLKTAAVSAPIGGVISKVTGGTFSEGAGAGVGSAPAMVTTSKILSKVFSPDKIKAAVNKVDSKLNVYKRLGSKATESARAAGEAPWDKVQGEVYKQINSSSNTLDRARLMDLYNKEYLSTMGQHSGIPGVKAPGSYETLLEARRGIQAKWGGSGFLSQLINSLKDSQDPIRSQYNKIVYRAINKYLQEIPGVKKADAAIWILNQVKGNAKDIGLTGGALYGIRKAIGLGGSD